MTSGLKGKKIVIVEDDVLILQALAEYFGANNEVLTYTSGELLRDQFAGTGMNPDIFILDYKLPGMNGLDLFKQFRPKFPAAKYICISGEMSVELAQDVQSLGFDALILKPFDFQILEKNIQDLVAAG